MPFYDPYVRRASPALGKNHDELLYDPARDMEPATKRYTDSLFAAVFDYASVSRIGAMYGPSWGSGISINGLVVADIGLCTIMPMHVTPGSRWTLIRGRLSNASSSTHRIGIYTLSQSTWLPTELLLDAGTMVWTGTGGDRSKAIDLTIVSGATGLIGLGWLYESRADAVNPGQICVTVPYGLYWPPGFDPAGTNLQTPINFRIQCTGNAPGAMPAPSAFSLSSTGVTVGNTQPFLAMTRG